MPPDVTPPDPLLGRQMGEFRIVRKLAEGGFGQLHVARHVYAPDLLCVVKTLLPQYAHKEWYRQRFMREGEALAKLAHDHIVEIKALGIDTEGDDPTGHCYIVMRYLRGETLDQTLKREGKLELRQVLTIVAQIASALQAAHDIGIVHRDLKPANVFLQETKGGKINVKLIDFGLAHDENAKDGLKTKTGSIFGTQVYSASEQLEDSSRVTPLSDVFSLAVICFEMITGVLPWPIAPSTVLQHQWQKLPPAPPAKQLMPPPVRAVVFAGLSHDPEARQQSVREFAMALASATPQGAQIMQAAADDLCVDVPPEEMTLRGSKRVHVAAAKILPRLHVRAPALDELLANAIPNKTPVLRVREREPMASPAHESGMPAPAVTQNIRAARAPTPVPAAAEATTAPPNEWPQRSVVQSEGERPVELDDVLGEPRPPAQRTTARPVDVQPEPWLDLRPPVHRTTARSGDAQPEPWLALPSPAQRTTARHGDAQPGSRPVQRTTARPGDSQPEPWFESRPPAQRTTARPADAQPDPLVDSPRRVAALFSAARPLDSHGNPMLSAATPPSEQRFQTLDLGVVPAGTPRSIAVPHRAYWKLGIVIGMALVTAASAGAWALFAQVADSPDLNDQVNTSARADVPPDIGSSPGAGSSTASSSPALPPPSPVGSSSGAGSSTASSSPAPLPMSSNGSNIAAASPATPSAHRAETPDPDAGVPVASRPATPSSAGSAMRDAAAEDLSTARSGSAAATSRSRAAAPTPSVVRGEGELFVALAPGLGSATIYIDSKNLGDTPYRGRLAAGTHIIRVVSNADAKKIKIYKVTIKPDTETERTVKDWQ